MPMHDWTRVEPDIYHAFHQVWAGRIMEALNAGILPKEFYALIEQTTVRGRRKRAVPDVLTLKGPSAPPQDESPVALAAPPKSKPDFRWNLDEYRRRKNVVSVRHSTSDRVVAMIEIISPGNKAGRRAFGEFVDKAADLLDRGIHLLLIDPFPPTPRDPGGIHAAIWDQFYDPDETTVLPPGKPLTLVGYEVDEHEILAYVERLAVGDRLPDMPLFLQPGGCVMVPLEATYTSAFAAVPRRWRTVIEGTAAG
jgi:hypothetical protein